MSASKWQRYIKDQSGNKVKMMNTSVNIRTDQHEDAQKYNLNVSEITRDALDEVIRQVKQAKEKIK